MFHRHQFEIRSVKEFQYAVSKGDVTVVLSKCTKCPKIQTQNIPGTWTRDELGL